MDIEQSYESVEISNQGGYQSPQLHLDDMPFCGYLLDQLDFFPKFLYDTYWVNINRKGNYNVTHTHPGSDFAVVWNITDNGNKLVIQNPLNHTRYNWRAMRDPDERELDLKAGYITIFPSDVPHYVEPHDLDTPRISVAFNLISDI